MARSQTSVPSSIQPRYGMVLASSFSLLASSTGPRSSTPSFPGLIEVEIWSHLQHLDLARFLFADFPWRYWTRTESLLSAGHCMLAKRYAWAQQKSPLQSPILFTCTFGHLLTVSTFTTFSLALFDFVVGSYESRGRETRLDILVHADHNACNYPIPSYSSTFNQE